MTAITNLNVFLGDRNIGTITLLPNDKSIFSFTDKYVADVNRPALSLSYKDIYGELITDRDAVQARLEPFFSNLLPEGHLREYLATRAGVKDGREFYLMWILGQDLPGNVTVLPADGEDWPPVADKSLAREEIEARHRQTMRFSLAGVQLKFSALIGSSGSLTIPAHGTGGSWIVKLPSAKWNGVPENEYSMMEFARRMGMDVPEVKLISMDDIGGMPQGIGDMSGDALAVKRFDRTDSGERIHIEDFAQVFNLYPERKYERGNYRNIAEVIWNEIGEEAIIEYVKRLIFNALIGNGDMHMKNWSLIYPDGRNAALAPAYDFLSTIPYMNDTDMALNLYRDGPRRFDELTLAGFISFAAKAKLPETIVINTVKETISQFYDLWPEVQKDLPIEKRVAASVEKHLKTIPMAQ
ncbi:MAG: kinase [Alphaproteobacteria bacterium]|nr:MAG: kinase [Alphaproteobacteria bacterium]